jgi:hypothetical protein
LDTSARTNSAKQPSVHFVFHSLGPSCAMFVRGPREWNDCLPATIEVAVMPLSPFLSVSTSVTLARLNVSRYSSAAEKAGRLHHVGYHACSFLASSGSLTRTSENPVYAAAHILNYKLVTKYETKDEELSTSNLTYYSNRSYAK